MGLTAFRALYLVACFALTACAGITGFGSPQGEVASLPLYGGQVVAASPANYCIAPSASRPTEGFAVLVRCQEAGPGTADAFVTLQIGATDSGLTPNEAAELRTILQSGTGRGLLSQTGAATTIAVEATEVAGDIVTVRFRDVAPPPVAGLQSTEWRGFFGVNGRLATVAVRGLAAAPLGTDDGEVLLGQTIAAVRQANVLPETAPEE